MTEKIYMIELNLFNDRWERAWSWPGDYTMEEAQGLIASEHEGRHKYRISLIPEKEAEAEIAKELSHTGKSLLPKKPYRRHSAVTPLELKGASAMLKSAMKYLITMDNYGAWEYLYHANIAVLCELEAL